MGTLIYGAMFFAMRSCEFSKTQEKNPKTKLLTIGDITFYDKHNRQILKHLHKAKAVKITFRNQKNGEKGESIIRHRHHSIHGTDPVTIWASIVTRIRRYEGINNDTPINTVLRNGKLDIITANHVRSYIKKIVNNIGFKILGIKDSEVGTHSIRTSFATFLATANVDVKYIMIQGRWKSDCVLRYIRREIVDNGISIHILSRVNVLRRKLA